jgi:hypothetical protein
LQKETSYADVNKTDQIDNRMPGAVTLPGNNGVREPPLGVTGIIFKHNSRSFAYQVSISVLHVLNFIFCQVVVIYKYSSAI